MLSSKFAGNLICMEHRKAVNVVSCNLRISYLVSQNWFISIPINFCIRPSEKAQIGSVKFDYHNGIYKGMDILSIYPTLCTSFSADTSTYRHHLYIWLLTQTDEMKPYIHEFY